MRVNSTTGNQTKITGVRQSIYVGRDRLGDIAQRSDKFEARNRRGRVIGVFESALAAADAVSAAADKFPASSGEARPERQPGKQ